MIYLDHAATTPPRAEVVAAMLPYLTEHWGNPSSIHALGRRARQGLDEARERIAAIISAKPREIVFTGGGSEACNLAVKGGAWAASARGRHIITSQVEHKAVLNTCAALERHGFEVTYLPVDGYGRVEPDAVADAITERTVLVSLQYANNEVGTIQPVREIGAICRERRLLFHVDAIAAAPFLPLDVDSMQATFVTLSAHKLHGPKGVGALFVRQGTPMVPQVQGGSQERQRRAGTEDVAGIVGFGVALGFAHGDATDREAANRRMAGLRKTLLDRLTALDGVHLTGHPLERLPNSASVVIDGVEGGDLVAALDLEGIAASTGSACTSGSTEPSHVLLAMGLDPRTAHGSLRLTLGRQTTADEVRATAEAVERGVERLRAVIGPRPAVASV